MSAESNEQFLGRVFGILNNNPTAADMDTLIQAHARVGRLSAIAFGEADYAEAVRKHAQAKAFAEAVNRPGKVSAALAEQLAEVEVFDLRKQEIEARTNARKLLNLLNSIEQAINGVKHLDKFTGPVGITP